MNKKINLHPCIGSDTLFDFYNYEPDEVYYLSGFLYDAYPDAYFAKSLNHSFTEDQFDVCKVAENIWQSTANNLVIPDGLVCDVQYFDFDTGRITLAKSVPSTEVTGNSDAVQANQWFVGNVMAIKVTGVADGWEY